MFRKYSIPAILTFCVLLLTACSSSGSQKLLVTTSDFKFIPKTWTVPGGKEIQITIKNTGSEDHEWVILKKGTEVTVPFDADDEEKVLWEMEAGPGETKTETFTAPSVAGIYTIVCGAPSHIEHGMMGTLTVR